MHTRFGHDMSWGQCIISQSSYRHVFGRWEETPHSHKPSSGFNLGPESCSTHCTTAPPVVLFLGHLNELWTRLWKKKHYNERIAIISFLIFCFPELVFGADNVESLSSNYLTIILKMRKNNNDMRKAWSSFSHVNMLGYIYSAASLFCNSVQQSVSV